MADVERSESGLAGRYAAALFDLAEAKGEIDRAASDLETIRDLIDASPDLERMLRSPLLRRDEQGRALASLMERAGIGDLVRRFVGVVTAERRLFALRDMVEAFFARLAEHRGEVVAEISSAQPIADDQLAAIRQALSAAVRREVKVKVNVDEDLIGGFLVKVGSRMVDGTLKTKLRNLEAAMKEVG